MRDVPVFQEDAREGKTFWFPWWLNSLILGSVLPVAIEAAVDFSWKEQVALAWQSVSVLMVATVAV